MFLIKMYSWVCMIQKVFLNEKNSYIRVSIFMYLLLISLNKNDVRGYWKKEATETSENTVSISPLY